MAKPVVTFIGAGSAVFTKNIAGDILQRKALAGAEIRLMDINPERLAESPIEALDFSAHETARANEGVIPRTLHEDVVAGADERRDGDEIRSRAAGRRDHPIRGNAVVRRNRAHQGRITVVVRCRQVERLASARQIVENAGQEVAAREVDGRGGPRLGPEQVWRQRRCEHG